MKKAHHHKVMSTIKFCKICGKPLKKRIEEQKPSANLCYKHWRMVNNKGPKKEKSHQRTPSEKIEATRRIR